MSLALLKQAQIVSKSPAPCDKLVLFCGVQLVKLELKKKQALRNVVASLLRLGLLRPKARISRKAKMREAHYLADLLADALIKLKRA